MHNCFPALHWESGFLVFSFSVTSQDCGWLITVWRRLRRSWNLIHIKFRATALECWLIFRLHQVIELLCKHGSSEVLERLWLQYVSNYVLKRFPCVYKFPLKAAVSHNPVQEVPEYQRTDRKWCMNAYQAWDTRDAYFILSFYTLNIWYYLATEMLLQTKSYGKEEELKLRVDH